MLQRETELSRIEGNRASDIVYLIADAVKALDERGCGGRRRSGWWHSRIECKCRAVTKDRRSPASSQHRQILPGARVIRIELERALKVLFGFPGQSEHDQCAAEIAVGIR